MDMKKSPPLVEDFLHSEGLLNRLFSQRVITGGRFLAFTPKPPAQFSVKTALEMVIILLSEAVWTGPKRLCRKAFRLYSGHSHSILAGGLVVTSSTTRFTCGTSLTILAEIVRTTSYGMRAQSAVMKSSVVTARMATV